MTTNTKINMTVLVSIVILMMIYSTTRAQSTCPVVQSQTNSQSQQQQQCKCGIKIDGHIYIFCARKRLTSLPQFTRSSILYDELILSGNSIQHISAGAFKGLRVKRLFLDANPLRTIETGSFKELANYLEELIISVNENTDDSALTIESSPPLVPSTLFRHLLNLKLIKLVGMAWQNGAQTLSRNTFNRTRKLEVIHLAACRLLTVEQGAFAGVEFTLSELNLDDNLLSRVDSVFGEARRMRKLKKLTLSRNNIRSVGRFSDQKQEDSTNTFTEQEIDDLHVDLSFNAIEQVDEYGFGITSYDINSGLARAITTLSLNNNEIAEHQLTFIAQLINLRELNMDYNRIRHLPDNLFAQLRHLESLSLRGNRIAHLTSEFTFSGLHLNLRRLNLESNQLRSIGKRVFMQTNKLAELNLNKNELGKHFTKLEKELQSEDTMMQGMQQMRMMMTTFEGVESELKTLSLENNDLKATHLWSLANLLNLQSLRLGNNPKLGSKSHQLIARRAVIQEEGEEIEEKKTLLSGLSGVFKFYRNLTSLTMQNTSLYQIPYFQGLNSTLRTFTLSRNRICNVNSQNVQKLYSQLETLNLNANPLRCDCRMAGMRQWVDDLMIIKQQQQQQQNQIQQNQQQDSSIPGVHNHQNQQQQSSMIRMRMQPKLGWKCETGQYFGRMRVSDLQRACNLKEEKEQENENECQLDEDYRSLVTKTTTTSALHPKTTTKKVISTTSIPTTEHEIVVEYSTTATVVSSLFQASSSSSLSSLGMNRQRFAKSEQQQQQQQQQQIKHSQKHNETLRQQQQQLFSSIELKQTLLGSFIGALSVLLIVCVTVCVVKSTSIKTSTDNSNTNNNSSKFSLFRRSRHSSQGSGSSNGSSTGSSGCSAKSSLSDLTAGLKSGLKSASSSNNTTNNTTTTNATLLLNQSQNQQQQQRNAQLLYLQRQMAGNASPPYEFNKLNMFGTQEQCFFTKMDQQNNGFPYSQHQLQHDGTMSPTQNQLIYQHYLTSSLLQQHQQQQQQFNQQQQNSEFNQQQSMGNEALMTLLNNSKSKVYLANANNASGANLNDNNINTYDKLHGNNSNSMKQQQPPNETSSTSSSSSPSTATASTAIVSPNGGAQAPQSIGPNGETTPFLIITNGDVDVNGLLLNGMNGLTGVPQMINNNTNINNNSINNHEMVHNKQPTDTNANMYHEIGDTLFNPITGQQQQQQPSPTPSIEKKNLKCTFRDHQI